MPIELGRRLIAAGVVAAGEVEAALFLSVVRGQPFTRVLLDRGAISERALEEELDRVGGLALRQVVAAADLVARVPIGMCRRLCAIPVRIEALTGVVDVAAADPLDPHVATELAFHLGTPVRVLRAPTYAIEEAIRRLELDAPEQTEERAASRNRRATPPFPHGAPQSSIPPPSEMVLEGQHRIPTADETPIPLVRRVEGRASMADLRAVIEAPPVPPPSPSRPRLAIVAEESAEENAMTERKPAEEASFADLRYSDPPPPEPTRRSEPSRPPPDPGPALRAATLEASFSPPRALRRAPVALLGDVKTRAPEELPSVRFPSQPPPSSMDGVVVIPKAPGVPLDDGRGGRRLTPRAGTPAMRRTTSRPSLKADIGQRTESAGVLAEAIAPQTNGAATEAGPTIEEQRVRAVLRGDPMPVEEGAPEPHRRVRRVDPGVVFDQLDAATTRDEVVKHALRGMRLVAKRVALFAVKREGFRGWACNVELADPESFRDVLVPAGSPSALATAAAAGHYLGPLRPSPAHEALLAIAADLSSDVAIATVRVGGRPAMMLFADELYDTLMGTRFLEELAKGVGEALSRLLAR